MDTSRLVPADGITDTSADGALGPITLTARTEQRYSVPLLSPVTVIGDDVPDPVTGPGVQLTL